MTRSAESARRRAPSVIFKTPTGGRIRRALDRLMGKEAEPLQHRVSGGAEGGVGFDGSSGEGAAWTDRGRGLKYDTNQDGFLVADDAKGLTWLVVCDGVGGHGAGDLASDAVLRFLGACFDRGLDLLDAIRDAPTALSVFNRELPAEQRNFDMSTTVVAAAIRGRSLTLVHAGDSRAMLIRGGEFVHETRDHTLAQQMADEGSINANEVAFHPDRTLLTRSIMLEEGGAARPVTPEVTELTLEAGDLLMICSDGYEPYVPSEILEMARRGKRPRRIVSTMRRKLHTWVNSDRTDDNATLVLYLAT